MKPILFFLIGLCIISCSCSSDDPVPYDPPKELPPITTSGAGTFGCLINGEVWLPEGPGSPFSPNPHAKFDESSRTLQLNASILNQTGNTKEFIRIVATEININTSNLKNASYLIPINSECYDYNTQNEQTNLIEIIKLEETEDIISGTFNFTVIDTICNDTLHITDGRFDLTYYL